MAGKLPRTTPVTRGEPTSAFNQCKRCFGMSLISNSHTLNSVTVQIYLVYGRGKSNSNIIKELRMDKKAGIDRLHLC